MVVYERHPLRGHGLQQSSRWTSSPLVSIDDRDDSLYNMSIETCFTNWAENAASDNLNDNVVRDILCVRVDPTWHTRSPPKGTRMCVAAAGELEEITEGAEEVVTSAEINDNISAVSDNEEQGTYSLQRRRKLLIL